MNKKLIATVLAGAVLLFAAALAWPTRSQAATLSAGSATYVIDGEEVLFPFDPITRKEGVLLPLELFTHLGVTVSDALEQRVTLTYGPVTAQVTVGRLPALVGGERVQLSVTPMRLNGRLFLPAELLEAFGLAFAQEGNFVTINRHVQAMPPLTALPAAEFRALKQERTVHAAVKADSGIYLEAEFTLLTQAMLLDLNLKIDYGTRARLLGLLESQSLMLVSLSNRSLKSGSLQMEGIYLVDQHRTQYEVATALDIGDGLVTGKLAPAADRMGVLVVPKLADGAGPVKLYYEGNGVILGQFVTGG